jgi:hypothetical protein
MSKNINSDSIVNNKTRKPTAKKEFSLSDYKKDAGLDKAVKFKQKRWLPIKNVLGETAFMQSSGLPNGLLLGECTQIQGHTDSGKSSLLWEIAYSCQQNNILPVFIITELKFSWDHIKLMGIEYDEVIDEETGEVSYEGNFIYIDRSKFDTIEQMGDQINKLLDDQKSGKLPIDLMFLIDSIGTIQSQMSFEKSTSNNEWDAGSISRVFGKLLMPRINISKKDTYPYLNSMVIITQVWVRKPEVFRGLPKLASKGGDTIPFNSTLQITFGNVTNSGVTRLVAKKTSGGIGKQIVYAVRTKVSITKNHINGVSLTTKLVATPHGFIMDSPNDVIAKQYFKEHSDYFMKMLDGGDITDVVFDEDSSNENEDFQKYSSSENFEMDE